MSDRSVTLIAAVAVLACVGVLVAGIVSASTDHTRPIKCPPGWKPNTGYLQHGCIPR